MTTMSTPLNNLPIKPQSQGDNSDLQDPLVQDVLKEFEEELAASKKTQQINQPVIQQYQQIPQQQYQQQYQQQQSQQQSQNQSQQQYQQHSQQPIPQQNQETRSQYLPKKNLLDFDVTRKVLIITLVILLLIYSNIFDFLYTKLPSNISTIASTFDIYIKSILIFITLYILSLYEIV